MVKKLQVFVSSTYTDMFDERQAAVEAILSAGHIPAGMELFNAGNDSQLKTIKRWIDESDVYLLIQGGRYGSVDPKSKKSYVEIEYRYAVRKKKPVFAVIVDNLALEKKLKKFGSLVIEKDNPDNLKSFLDFVKRRICRFYTDKKDIKIAIHETLNKFFSEYQFDGWVSGSVLNNQFEHQSLDNAEYVGRSVRDYFVKRFHELSGSESSDHEFNIDASGNCRMQRTYEVNPISKFPYYWFEVFSDKPGLIDLEVATDLDTGRDIKTLLHKLDDTAVSMIFLFEEEKKPRRRFKLRFVANAENFVSNLIESGVGRVSTSTLGKVRLSNCKEKYSFPNTKQFQNLKATIISHPMKGEIGKVIKPRIKAGRKIIEINYACTKPHIVPLTVEFSI